MPIYIYRAKTQEESCEHCSNSFEVFQPMSADSLTKCPKCGAALNKIIQPTPFVNSKTTKDVLSDDNLKKNGFKKLVNSGGGKFDVAV